MHVLLHLIVEIISTFPKTMHTKPSIKNKGSGQIKNVKHGGNLGAIGSYINKELRF